jgi:hypothetical protein
MVPSLLVRVIRRSSGFVVGAYLVLLPLGGCEPGADPCSVHDDCAHSKQLSNELGRCAPKEFFCDDSECTGWCRQTCTVISERVNPCSDASLICSQKAGEAMGACQGLPIACSTAADCPLFRPSEGGVWACATGVCRFPGFEYALR